MASSVMVRGSIELEDMTRPTAPQFTKTHTLYSRPTQLRDH